MCDDPLLNVKQLAAWLGVETWWLYDQVMYRKIPHLKLNSHLRFRRSDIEKWLVEKERAAEVKLKTPRKRRAA